jgi:hypothetical protein
MVDYDANLLAVAFGVADDARSKKILARVDAGPCAHGRATWVSERFYDEAHCYGGNIGGGGLTTSRLI